MNTIARFGARLCLLGICLGLAGCGWLFGDDANDPESIDASEGLSQATATLSRVIDGDSVELGVDGAIEEFRLRGVNAPETGTCGAQEAADALAELLAGKELQIELDLEEPRDRFGRLLGELQANGVDVSNELVERGLVYPLGGSTSVRHEGALRASDAGLGVWDPDRCGISEVVVAISAFVPDPAGDDAAAGAGEFIELENTSSNDIDLDGWTVRDESTSNVYVFANTTLGAGERLRLYSTCGNEDANTRFWCSSSPVWSNIGDTALVLDPAGNTIDFRFSP